MERADAMLRVVCYHRDRVCVRCGNQGTDTAHIIPRRYHRLRCDPTNVRWLCRPCHRGVDQHEWEWHDVVPVDELDRLWGLARDASWKRPVGWFDAEATRLLGIRQEQVHGP